MNNAKTVFHVFIQVKVVRRDEVLFSYVEQLDAVQHEHAYLVVDMTPPDQIERAVKEPNFIRGHLSGGLALGGHGVIAHLYYSELENRVVDLLDDFLEPGVVLKRLEADMEGLLDASQIREALRRQRGLDFAEQFIQGFVEYGIFENPEDVPVKIKTHQFCDRKGNRQVEPVPCHKAPSAFPAVPFGVKGEAGGLDGCQISPDGSGMAAFLCSKFCHSGAMCS